MAERLLATHDEAGVWSVFAEDIVIVTLKLLIESGRDLTLKLVVSVEDHDMATQLSTSGHF